MNDDLWYSLNFILIYNFTNLLFNNVKFYMKYNLV